MGNRGVLYIAMGDGFFKEAELSAESLKKHNPELETCLITDEERESEFFDQIKIEEPNKGSDKIQYIDRSPFDQTLFLDTDTLIVDNITELFTLLEEFDIAMSQNPMRVSNNNFTGEKNDFKNIPVAFPELNGGIILFQNNEKFRQYSENVREFYRERQEEYGEKVMEQPVFRKELYESDLRLMILPPEYNCRLNYGGVVSEKVKIGHARLIDFDAKWGLVKKLDVRESLDKLNSEEGIRVFYYHKGTIKVRKRKESLKKLLLNSIRDYGASGTFKRVLNKLKQGKINFTKY